MKVGKFVTPEISYQWLNDYLQYEGKINYNSSFYRDFETVILMNREDIWRDQVMHYASTYGTDFQGEAWIPERTRELPTFEYSKLTKIDSMDLAEFKSNFFDLLYSNIAMSPDLIRNLMEIIDEFNWSELIKSEFNLVKNRELRYNLRPQFGIKSYCDGQDCLMQLLYNVYGVSMLVKSRDQLDYFTREISSGDLDVLRGYLTDEYRSELLASVFLRNKDVFLSIKKGSGLHSEINKLRKMAKKLHKPLDESPWLHLDKLTAADRLKLYNKESFFKLAQIYQAYEYSTVSNDSLYIIRNGKSYFKVNMSDRLDLSFRQKIAMEIYNVIVARVRRSYLDKVIKLPDYVELAIPTSEKNFIGDIPFGSYIELDRNSAFGIYWRNEWGANDLDLHAMTLKGEHIGWNGSYNSNGVIFSGDMTDANPEAVEVFSIGKDSTNCEMLITANVYRGDSNSRFRIIYASKGIRHSTGVIDPTKIKFKADVKFLNSREMTLGFVANKRFIFTKMATADRIVPKKNKELISHFIEYMKVTNSKSLSLRSLLMDAGVYVVSGDESSITEVDYDLSTLSKAELIRLLSI